MCRNAVLFVASLSLSLVCSGDAVCAQGDKTLEIGNLESQKAGSEELLPAILNSNCEADASAGNGAPASRTCKAVCQDGYPPVSCSGSSCLVLDAACPEFRGRVECDGNIFWCPECEDAPPDPVCGSTPQCTYFYNPVTSCCESDGKASLCPTIC